MIEQHFRRHPGIRTAENDGERIMSLRELHPAPQAVMIVARDSADETFITGEEPLQGLVRVAGNQMLSSVGVGPRGYRDDV